MRTPTLLPALICIISLSLALPQAAALPQSSASRPGRKYSLTERLQPDRLRAVQQARRLIAASRKAVSLRTGYNDYKAILHAHAEDAQHTGGTRPELLRAAKATGISVIMLTDHVRPHRDFINDSWRGMRDGVLFIPGAEAEGFLVYPQRSIKDRKWRSRDEYISMIKEGGGDIFLSHIEERPDWPTAQLDGMEIYNVHADFKGDQFEFAGWLRKIVSDPDRLTAFQKLLAEYPQEIFGASQDYLSDYIAKWDRESLAHRVAGVAANDCHHNQVVTVKVADAGTLELWLTGDKEPSLKVTATQSPRLNELTRHRQPGEVIATLDLDPYERSLSYVSTHILAGQLNEAVIRQALRQGHTFVAHDWLCDATGFAFVAAMPESKPFAVMGDEFRFRPGAVLLLAAPAEGLIRLFRNGVKIAETKGREMRQMIPEPGTYRAEVWLEIDGEERPWIYASPIRVIPASRETK
ncbi:MAG TPA: histidinol phosphatase [Blastocatellia bacterium]|nr:histidinol phosphatase [Blastocatellia bacterium]